MPTPMPSLFQALIRMECLSAGEIYSTGDGFFTAARSLSDILKSRRITTFPNDQGQERQCDRFFDDWFLYALPREEGHIYSLHKMREQEHDSSDAIPADGDAPGVTVSFIAFAPEVLLACLEDPAPHRRSQLNREINRVVAAGKQNHHRTLKDYFCRPEAQAPYLIAELYVRHMASFSREGILPLPLGCQALYARFRKNPRCADARIPRFLEENNRAAGYPLCDGKNLRIADPKNLTLREKLAILAAHTGDISYHAFAAEIRYHACFLVPLAKIPIPILGRSVYDSAIRADMSIEDPEFEGPAPYHDPGSRWVREQEQCHPDPFVL